MEQDRLDLAELHSLARRASDLIHQMADRHNLDITGVALAAEASTLADLRAVEMDADTLGRYLGAMDQFGGAV